MAQLNIQTTSNLDPGYRGSTIPTNIVSRNLLSPTADALTCFTQQQFSNKLQGYLVSYVFSVSGDYSVYAK